MKISVIIPVYNAERFVEKAVESALSQPETAEVLLIEDKSPDNSLHECREIAAKNDKVRLLQHPDKENHGAGASRNLGIQNAKYNYIAFLDADDFFNSGRFSFVKEIMLSDDSVDGVYEAIGAKIEDTTTKSNLNSASLTTIHGKVSAKDLLDVLTLGNFGHFHCNGLVVKRSIFSKCGLFQYRNEVISGHPHVDENGGQWES